MQGKWIVVLFIIVLSVGMFLVPISVKAASCVWTGETSTDWETNGNWSSCSGENAEGPPIETDDAVIDRAPTNQPILDDDVTIASLTLNSGAELTISSGRTLTVTGDIYLNADGGETTTISNLGELRATAGTFTTSRSDGSGTANLVIGSTGTWILQDITTHGNTRLVIEDDPTIRIRGNVSRSGVLDPGTSTMIFDSDEAQSLSGGSQHFFYNLEIAAGTTLNHTVGSGGIHIQNDFTNNGALTQSSGAAGRRVQFAYNVSHPESNLAGDGTTRIARVVIDANKTVNAGTHSITIDSNDSRIPWENDGTFNGDVATVVFNGDSIAEIIGTGTNNFHNVVISNTLHAGEVDMNVTGNWTANDDSTFVITGTVTFNGETTQNLTLNTPTTFNDLVIAEGTTLVETIADDNATVAGALTNNGVLRKSQTVDGAGAYSFGLTGVTLDVSDPGTLEEVQVDRVDSSHPQGTGTEGGSGTRSGRYWSITASSSDFELDMTLPHDLDANHGGASVCRHEVDFIWDCARTESDATTVTRAGITTLSDWAVGSNVGPTAVTLTSFRAYSSGPDSWFGEAIAAFGGWLEETIIGRLR